MTVVLWNAVKGTMLGEHVTMRADGASRSQKGFVEGAEKWGNDKSHFWVHGIFKIIFILTLSQLKFKIYHKKIIFLSSFLKKVLKFYLTFNFILEYTWLKMCYVQVYSNIIQLYVYMYLLFFQNLFQFRLLHNTEQSSLCYSVGPFGCVLRGFSQSLSLWRHGV